MDLKLGMLNKVQVFINKCLRRILIIWWLKNHSERRSLGENGERTGKVTYQQKEEVVVDKPHSWKTQTYMEERYGDRGGSRRLQLEQT